MKSIALFVMLLASAAMMGQQTISGTVLDASGQALEGANVYLDGTYDGASTGTDGHFSFETEEKGTQTLIVSMLGYEPFAQSGDVSYLHDLKIGLSETVNALSGVTLTAGTFQAGDNSKASVLKPLDVVTTASALGDVVGALQTLPGTAKVGGDGRLFVRGGGADEAQVFVDGQRVFQPFGATVQNVPTRGRFSPFLFKGITFSTGGYSAEYGQALSSVLLLNTTDLAEEEKTDISIMSVGAGLGHTKIWGKQSLSVNASYINLAPYQGLFGTNKTFKWVDPVESFSGEAVFRSQGTNGLFKLYTGVSHSAMALEQQYVGYDELVPFSLKNDNLYLNATYRHFLSGNWTVYGGASVANDKTTTTFSSRGSSGHDLDTHLKVKIKKGFSNNINLNFGGEYIYANSDRALKDSLGSASTPLGVYKGLGAFFTEGDWNLNQNLAVRLGIRATGETDRNGLLWSPRASVVRKLGKNDQLSLAYGKFYQDASMDYLQYNRSLASENTDHYILSYQLVNDIRTFRVEAYRKDYHDLVKYTGPYPTAMTNFSNDGHGYSQGVDVFWRENKRIKNLDYWVSYSFLDTQREYGNFPEEAVPSFAPKHSFSVVGKYWVDKWRSQIGASYGYTSGRTFHNAFDPNFGADKTKAFQDLSLNWAYLLSPQKILYFSAGNVLGFKNENGYQYAQTPDANGAFAKQLSRPAADRFFFVGFFWTISSNKNSNQLDNL